MFPSLDFSSGKETKTVVPINLLVLHREKDDYFAYGERITKAVFNEILNELEV